MAVKEEKGLMGVSLPKSYIERLRRDRIEIGIPISTHIRKLLEKNWESQNEVLNHE